tara:strand:- start:3012 stop:3296 length:285 start_codon:yes stop_codon:yes gene_type:complete
VGLRTVLNPFYQTALFTMHDSTLDLFTEHDDVLDDQQHMIDTMRDALYDAMHTCVNDGRPDDAVSVYSEWCVDGADPENGNYVFTFLPDLTDAE